MPNYKRKISATHYRIKNKWSWPGKQRGNPYVELLRIPKKMDHRNIEMLLEIWLSYRKKRTRYIVPTLYFEVQEEDSGSSDLSPRHLPSWSGFRNRALRPSANHMQCWCQVGWLGARRRKLFPMRIGWVPICLQRIARRPVQRMLVGPLELSCE